MVVVDLVGGGVVVFLVGIGVDDFGVRVGVGVDDFGGERAEFILIFFNTWNCSPACCAGLLCVVVLGDLCWWWGLFCWW